MRSTNGSCSRAVNAIVRFLIEKVSRIFTDLRSRGAFFCAKLADELPCVVVYLAAFGEEVAVREGQDGAPLQVVPRAADEAHATSAPPPAVTPFPLDVHVAHQPAAGVNLGAALPRGAQPRLIPNTRGSRRPPRRPGHRRCTSRGTPPRSADASRSRIAEPDLSS